MAQDLTFKAALNELMDGSGISNNELARRIEVDAAQVGRWRKGNGLPRPDNIIRVAAVFGVDREWLLGTAYPEARPAANSSLDPRLSAFLTEIEAAWRAMDDQTRAIAERGARALFRVDPIRRKRRVTTEPEELGRPKIEAGYQRTPRWRREMPETDSQRLARALRPAYAT